MALRLSTGLKNFILSGGSLKQALTNGRLDVFSGTQPTTADSAFAGTLLTEITNASGTWVAETAATATITLTGGASGSITNVTIDSISILDATVNYNTSLNQTAADLAAALARSSTNMDWEVGVSGAIVTLTAKPNIGTKYNGKTLAVTATTITSSVANPSGGALATNGLWFEDASAGAVTKRATQAWTGVASVSNTAGWFRFYGPKADAGADDATGTALRLDGAISTSGGELNMTNTAITALATQTVTVFSPTMP